MERRRNTDAIRTINKHVYCKIAAGLNKAGINKTGEQCRSKMKKLRQDYKKLKIRMGILEGAGQSGNIMMLWMKFWDPDQPPDHL